MLSLVSSSTPLSSQALSQQLINDITYRNRQYRLWESCNQKAYQFHQRQDFKQALNYFLKSVSISQELKNYFFGDSGSSHSHSSSTGSSNFDSNSTDSNSTGSSKNKSGVEMFYFSCHNLASCYNALGESGKAITLLSDLHHELMDTVRSPFKAKKVRIEALANLDKALFSLCSQLSYVNQIDNIHQLILQTEKVASTAFNQLVDFIPQAQNKEEK